MRIALIDQHGNPGGVVRFLRALSEGLAEAHAEDSITVFATAPVLATEAMRSLVEGHANIGQFTLEDSNTFMAPAPRGGRVRAALRRVGPLVRLYRRLRGLGDESEQAGSDPTFRFSPALVEKLAEYDVVYLAWPVFVEPVDLPTPVVATFHDFNYRRSFANYTPEMVEMLERQVPGWLQRAGGIICSTDFIASELRTYYPDVPIPVDVIPLASFITSHPSPETVANVVRRFGLPEEYVLCPSNVARHKNLQALFKAHAILTRQREIPPLVVCGWGTDMIGERMRGKVPPGNEQIEFLAGELKASGLKLGQDVRLLGYISDADVDALVAGASLVVSASEYEAGSGPALDAWLLGTPVALSDIPPHREQTVKLGTHAAFFDQADPGDVARVIAGVLDADTSVTVRESAEHLSRYDWKNVAERYRGVFERAIERGARASSV